MPQKRRRAPIGDFHDQSAFASSSGSPADLFALEPDIVAAPTFRRRFVRAASASSSASSQSVVRSFISASSYDADSPSSASFSRTDTTASSLSQTNSVGQSKVPDFVPTDMSTSPSVSLSLGDTDTCSNSADHSMPQSSPFISVSLGDTDTSSASLPESSGSISVSLGDADTSSPSADYSLQQPEEGADGFSGMPDIAAPSSSRRRSQGTGQARQSRRRTARTRAGRPSVFDLGNPEHTCSFCGAFFWYEERCKSSSREGLPRYNRCCHEGRVSLLPLKEPPTFLQSLVNPANTADYMHYRDHIRQYNQMFALTSMGVRVDNTVNDGSAPYVFKISGQACHMMGSLLPLDGQPPRFAQLYIHDTANEIANRMAHFPDVSARGGLRADTVAALRDMLDHCNRVVQGFRTARERITASPDTEMRIQICADRVRRVREYAAPTAAEIVGLLVGDFNPREQQRDIIVEHRTGRLQRIRSIHPSFMALQYPLLFPYGEDSWHPDIYYDSDAPGSSQVQRDCVTMAEYYSYRVHMRFGESDLIFRSGRLFQQLCVDMYACIDQARIAWLHENQAALRSDSLANLRNAVAESDICGAEVGQKTILPASHVGSPRYLFQNYQDAVAVCRHLGLPHLFITFTCNPFWPEITRLLLRGQTAADRPDLVCRVFKMKLDELILDIKKNQIFGPVSGLIYTVEFQKRGLPHVHIIVWLTDRQSLTTPSNIDEYISAELPDQQLDHEGYQVVSQYMMHGPCGQAAPKAPCMDGRNCTKGYPKEFSDSTVISDDGFIIYKRRQSGISVLKGNTQLDNRSVVPYNLNLLIKFQAHINVERCHTALVIKYLFKYICKGSDRVFAALHRSARPSTSTSTPHQDMHDELAEYLDCRYLAPAEAVWRILQYDIHYSWPSMERLSIHLPLQNNIIFHDSQNVKEVIGEPAERTKLTAWFLLNQTDEVARQYTYSEIPRHYTWHKDKTWKTRKKMYRLGRIYYVHPSCGELYYLRMLLNSVRGAESFEQVRTVNGQIYPTFKEACCATGLLGDDNEPIYMLQEAAATASGPQLRRMFVDMLLHSQIANTTAVWNACWRLLAQDTVHELRVLLAISQYNVTDQTLQDYLLYKLQDLLAPKDRTLESVGLPRPIEQQAPDHRNRLIRQQLTFNTVNLRQEAPHIVASLNSEQLSVYRAIMQSVTRKEGKLFFVYGHGGTGKTHLWRALTSVLRAEGKIVLTVASSGIASLLMQGGSTAYTRFKIPLELSEASTCSIKKGTDLADLISRAALIIWDEAPMSNRICFEALDRTMCDLLLDHRPDGSPQTFGGKTVVLGGDFRQTLPVIPGGSRYDAISASILSSPLWQHCVLLKLTINMRLHRTDATSAEMEEAASFARWILSIGDGTLPGQALFDSLEPEWIDIPADLLIHYESDQQEAIIDSIYPQLQQKYQDKEYLKERAIVTPKNAAVEKLNDIVLKKIPGEEWEYFSTDSIDLSENTSQDIHDTYPVDFLNTITSGGLPCHRLVLKKGVPIMLLRNIDQPNGLCNGTRLIVTDLAPRHIQAEIITGSATGDIVYIPRIVFVHKNNTLPFKLRRKQFHVRVSYAMTINKSQGQSLNSIGVYLPEPVFAHGQFYVAVSRTTSRSRLKILISSDDSQCPNKTKNVVYREIFAAIGNGANASNFGHATQ